MKKILSTGLIVLLSALTITSTGCKKPDRDTVKPDSDIKAETKEDIKDEVEDPNDFSHNKEKYGSIAPDTFNRVYPDDEIKGILSAELADKIKPMGIWAHDDKIVISDAENNCLYELDSDGNVIRTVGKLGNAPLEFSYPCALYWNERQQLLYVSDTKNSRIQRLNKNLEYVDELHFGEYEPGYPNTMGDRLGYPTIAVDKDDRMYTATICANKMHVFELKDNSSTPISDKHIVGTLCESDDIPYFLEYGYIDTDDINDINCTLTTSPGPNDLYKITDGKLELVCSLPFKYTPGDMLIVDGRIFFSSETWRLIDEFKFEYNELKYVKTWTNQLSEEKHSEHHLDLSYNEGCIYLSNAQDGQIYKVKIK